MRVGGWNALDKRAGMDLRLAIFTEGGLRFVWICIIRVLRCVFFIIKVGVDLILMDLSRLCGTHLTRIGRNWLLLKVRGREKGSWPRRFKKAIWMMRI